MQLVDQFQQSVDEPPSGDQVLRSHELPAVLAAQREGESSHWVMSQLAQPGRHAPCDWCGRQGLARGFTEVNFGHVVVENPCLCDICAALLNVGGLRDGSSPREAGIDLALEKIGAGAEPDLLDARITRAVASRTRQLKAQLEEAVSIIQSLKAELLKRAGDDPEIRALTERLGA